MSSLKDKWIKAPNGCEGRILGEPHEDVVTIRMENGGIIKVPFHWEPPKDDAESSS